METVFAPRMFLVESFGAFAGFLDGLLATGVPPTRILETLTGKIASAVPKKARFWEKRKDCKAKT
jgi:hypothetical protein